MEAKYLSQVSSKTIDYTDIRTARIPGVLSQANFTQEVETSLSNIRWLLLCPHLSSITNGSSAPSNTTGGVCSVSESPFTSAPATCMPHASVTNFQIKVGGKPLWDSPRVYDYDMFMNEVRGNVSMNGGLQLGLSSGLIDQRKWAHGYGYIFVDLSRYGSDAEDLVSKGIRISGTNNTRCPVDYVCYIGHQQSFEISTSTGRITR